VPLPIQVGSVTQALQRAFGFKGRYTPMLDEVIVPVYMVSDPSPAGQTRICAGTFQAVAPNVSDLPAVQLFNPAGSGVIVNATTVIVSAIQKQEMVIAYFDTPLATEGFDVRFRDRRITGLPSAKLFREVDLLASIGGIVAVLQVDGTLAQTAAWVGDTQDPRQPLTVLAPGQGLIVQTSSGVLAVSDNVRVNWRWLEIPITEQQPPGGLP